MTKHIVTEKRGHRSVLLIMCEHHHSALEAIQNSVRSHCRACQSRDGLCECHLHSAIKLRHQENYCMVTSKGAGSPCGREWLVEISA